MSLLHSVKGPGDVQRLAPADLAALAAEIREVLVDTVSATGGHLGPNLGVVELTIAMHRVFSSPRDRLIFDTGHQAYVHKLLTGRGPHFPRLRQAGGLSGYPSRAESPHDHIENSHASTALSYADGLAKAMTLRGETGRHVVALVGDGALTGGMAWEALNNIASAPGRRIVIVVNDNRRSYSPTVGGFRPEMFKALGLTCLGPVDGHDEGAVEEALRRARACGRTVVVHCLTAKGRGYAPAERDELDHLHSPGPFDRATGQMAGEADRSWTHIFGDEMVRIGARHPDVVAITAAMLHPVGLAGFSAAFPDRVFDVGIAEQHAVTSAAGLAMGGFHPVVAIYSTFLNRAFDQVLMDVALHRLPVTLVLDRAGVTGNDGPSHHGMWDLSLLQMVPGLRVAAPRDAARLRELLGEAVTTADGPTAMRFPKGAAPPDIKPAGVLPGIDVLAHYGAGLGSASVLIVAVGSMADTCLEAAALIADRGIGVTVIDPRWIKPLAAGLSEIAAGHQIVAVVEDSGRVSGIGDAVARQLSDNDIAVPVKSFSIPQEFHAHGGRQQILGQLGLHPGHLASAITELAGQSRPAHGPVFAGQPEAIAVS